MLTCGLFVWLISHQPAVLFSHNKSATSNQPAVLFSQNKPAPAISHQPTEQADGAMCRGLLYIYQKVDKCCNYKKTSSPNPSKPPTHQSHQPTPFWSVMIRSFNIFN
jgi:hypothetical protein